MRKFILYYSTFTHSDRFKKSISFPLNPKGNLIDFLDFSSWGWGIKNKKYFTTVCRQSRNLIHTFILFTTILISSCEDVVDVEINNEDIDLISVEAYISNNSANSIIVKLEKTLPVNETRENPVINKAIVEISDDAPSSNTIVLAENGNSGVYTPPANTDFRVIPGSTYKLTIKTPEGVVITGEEYLQRVETLDTVKMNLSARGNYEFMAIFINSQETPGPGNYYKWDIYKNGRLLYNSENLSFASDILVDGNYIYDFEIFTDFTGPDDAEEDKAFTVGDTIVVHQLSISENAYNFYLGMVNQSFSGGPFSVPPANLPGNLTASDGKKVLGLFSARDVSVGNSIVLDSSNYVPLVYSLSSGYN